MYYVLFTKILQGADTASEKPCAIKLPSCLARNIMETTNSS